MSLGRPRSADKRAAILDAAVSLVAESGYAAATIEAVAARAGVAKTTVYRRWTSKAGLFVEAYTALMPSPPTGAGNDPLDDLRTALRDVFAVYRTTPAGTILVALIAAMPTEPEAAVEIHRQLVIGRRDVLLSPLRRAVAAGRLPKDLDLRWACETVIALIWLRLLTAPATLTPDYADTLVDRLITGGRQ